MSGRPLAQRCKVVWDHWETVYHLTPKSWEQGFETEREPPPERVESWKVVVDQRWPWSERVLEWTCLWASPWMSRDERDRLRANYFPLLGWWWSGPWYWLSMGRQSIKMSEPL